MSSRKSVASSIYTYVSDIVEPSTMWKYDETRPDDISDTPVDDPETFTPLDNEGSPIDVVPYNPPDLDIPEVEKKTHYLTAVLTVLVIVSLCPLAYLFIERVRSQSEIDLQRNKTDGTDTDDTGKPHGTGKPGVNCNLDKINWCKTREPTHEQLKCLPTSCAPSKTSKSRQMALFENFPVVCDTDTDWGNWVIIQRRSSKDVSFAQPWNEYANGFGNLCPTGNFWLGLNKVHIICGNAGAQCELRIDMEYNERPYRDDQVPDRKDNKYYANYHTFYISDETNNYRITIDGYSGTAGDGLVDSGVHGENINNLMFSTHDKDNDNSSISCATKWGGGGGWWYRDCLLSNLNGKWGRGSTVNARGVLWYQLNWFGNKSVTFSEIKIRRCKR